MIILTPTTIASVTASSAHANYPDDNLLVESAKLRWIAASGSVTSATVVFTCTGPVDCVSLFGAVVDTATLEYWTGTAYAALPGISATEYDDPFFIGYTNHWFTFTALTGSVQLRLTLTQIGSSTIRAANLHVGTELEVDGVEYPLQEGLIDTSIRTPLLNGEEYYKKRDTYRVFSGTARAGRATAVRGLLLDVARRHGSRPLPVRLAPPWGDDFLVYGRLSMPQAAHAWPIYSQVSFELVEVMGI